MHPRTTDRVIAMPNPADAPTWEAAVGQFFSSVSNIGTAVLVLNHDGLLPTRPFAATAGQLRVIAQLRELHHGRRMRLVLFTDRHWKKIANCLGFGPAPEIWGVGGLERTMPNGRYDGPECTAEQIEALSEAYEAAVTAGLQFWIEKKPGGVALRLDGFSRQDIAALSSRIWRSWSRIASDQRLTLVGVSHGLELRISGRTRQHAIQTIIAETSPSTPVCYVGTDVLDEPALRSAGRRALRVAYAHDYRRLSCDVSFRNLEVFESFLRECERLLQTEQPSGIKVDGGRRGFK